MALYAKASNCDYNGHHVCHRCVAGAIRRPSSSSRLASWRRKCRRRRSGSRPRRTSRWGCNRGHLKLKPNASLWSVRRWPFAQTLPLLPSPQSASLCSHSRNKESTTPLQQRCHAAGPVVLRRRAGDQPSAGPARRRRHCHCHPGPPFGSGRRPARAQTSKFEDARFRRCRRAAGSEPRAVGEAAAGEPTDAAAPAAAAAVLLDHDATRGENATCYGVSFLFR